MNNQAQDDDRAMSLADSALARPAEERESYLRRVCGANTELFADVWMYVQDEERMKGFLLEPLFPALQNDHPFEPGELLDGRFRIVREVAQGGMGVVYEAEDEKLDRRIALKCAKAGFGNRLPPEARNATAISHPNVCKTYEIHTTSRDGVEIDFLTMEFLDGETLSERLARGPVAPEEARALAIQLCAGVAEAHRNQIIHGDLKSNNVILAKGADGETRAVITDFGLARRPGAVLRAGSAAAGGTPDYMAPELWNGECATASSDIYALGVILHELMFGARRAGPETVKGARRDWERVTRRCLEAEPARRFASAGEIARALRPRSRRWMAVAAGAAVLALMSAGVTYRGTMAPRESMTLAMLPLTAAPEAAAAASAVSQSAAAQLERLHGGKRARLTVVRFADVARRNVGTVASAREQFGATQVVHGSARLDDGAVTLRVLVTDTRTQADSEEREFRYAPGEMLYAGAAIAGAVTAALRLPHAPPAAIKEGARQDYTAGIAFTRRNSTMNRALPLLQRAVEGDGDSPLTWAGLAEAQWFKFFITQDRAWLTQMKESLRQAENRDPDAAAVHRLTGLLRANAGLYEDAQAEYLRAIELEPTGDAFRRLGQAYERGGRLEQALAAFQKAVEMEPGSYKVYQDLGTYYAHRGNAPASIAQFELCVRAAPDEPDPHFVLGTAYETAGRYAEAERELRAALALGETPRAFNNLAAVLMDAGKERDAIPVLVRGLKQFPDRYLWWMNLGDAYRRTGDAAGALRAYRLSRDLAEKEVESDPRDGAVRALLAYVCARAGERRRAESEIGQALRLLPVSTNTSAFAVWTYEALGRREDSLAVLKAAPDQVLAEALRSIELAGLHQDSRFQDLVRLRQIH